MAIASVKVVRSNRTERLLDALCRSLEATPLANPLTREVLVVQGRGMAVWLNTELARRFGVWANADYVYPQHLIARIVAAIVPKVEEAQSYSRERLLWSLMAVLPQLLPGEEFAPLRNYLTDDHDGRKQFQLCDRITSTFDEYLTFRPELLASWERNRERSRRPKPTEGKTATQQLSLFRAPTADAASRWQESLWRAVKRKLGSDHPAIMEQRLVETLRQFAETQEPHPDMPSRIRVFGLSSLPPLYLRILCHVAKHIAVEIYVLSPTPGTQAHKPKEAPDGAQREPNPLHDSWGTLSTEFQQLLMQAAQDVALDVDDEPCFETPPRTTLLGRLQADILHDVPHTPPPASSANPDLDDDSIRIHSCHGATREVEVLHDQLLALIHEHQIEPHEIAVMAPNIDEYAPLIQAVFDRGTQDPRFIPYRISDRRLQGDSEVFDAFLRLLRLVSSRVSSVEVLDLLTQTCIRERFSISTGELETVRRWVVESGARWGIDADHRAAFNVPGEHANTWRFALDRLLIGYAVNTHGRATTLGVLPYEEIEGKTGELLGHFAAFLETLFAALEDLAKPRGIDAWQVTLGQVLDRLFSRDGDASWQHTTLLSALSELRSLSEQAGFTGELSVQVVEQLLVRYFDVHRSARGFLSGGVTFCAMTPMRSIPFRVVWLLGMNDGAFPRPSFRPDFNLLERSQEGRRPGDPNRRLDDRHLFLECLLSARERFVVSFVGQSARDNSPLPPAVVVSETLDAVVESNAVDARARGRLLDAIVLRHPLQPFSPRYYRDPSSRLFSYEPGYLQGAKLLSGERRRIEPLFDTTLPALEDEQLELSQLLEFFGSPTQALLWRRLGIDLREREFDIPEREPTVLDGLQLYEVGSTALQHRFLDIDEEESFQLLKAAGLLPAGAAADFEFQRALASARPIAERAAGLCTTQVTDRITVKLRIDDQTTLVGELGPLWEGGLVHVQFARVSGKHLLQTWIRHLALCCCAPPEVATFSSLIGRPDGGAGVEHVTLTAVDDARDQLARLVWVYRLGQTRPLMLFPETSRVFAEGLRRSQGDARRALFRAAPTWAKELQRNAALRRLYGPETPLSEDGPLGVDPEQRPKFRELAEIVFGPLSEHLREAR